MITLRTPLFPPAPADAPRSLALRRIDGFLVAVLRLNTAWEMSAAAAAAAAAVATMNHKLIRIRVASAHSNVSSTILNIALAMAKSNLGLLLPSSSVIHLDGDERGTAYIQKAKRMRLADKALGFDRARLF